jgi:hypothetical protein
LHSPETHPQEPADPGPSQTGYEVATTTAHSPEPVTTSTVPAEHSSAADPEVTKPVVLVDPDEPVTDRPVVDDEKDKNNESLWDFLLGKVDELKTWVEGLVEGDQKN